MWSNRKSFMNWIFVHMITKFIAQGSQAFKALFQGITWSLSGFYHKRTLRNLWHLALPLGKRLRMSLHLCRTSSIFPGDWMFRPCSRRPPAVPTQPTPLYCFSENRAHPPFLGIHIPCPGAQGRGPCLAKAALLQASGWHLRVLCPLLGTVLTRVGPGADSGSCWWLQPPGRLPFTALHLCVYGWGRPFKFHWPVLPVSWAVPAGSYLTWELFRCIFMEMSSCVNSPWPGF